MTTTTPQVPAIDEPVGCGRRPPARAERLDVERYTGEEFLRREYRHLWSSVWQLACLDSDVPEVGDFYEYVIGKDSIIVVRESADQIRAFHNVCLHRGRRIKLGAGNADELRCPYHGWRWRLDGSLREIPERSEFCPVSDADVGLREVRLEQWNHWVFVNLDPDAGPLAAHLGGIAEVLAPYRFDRQYKWKSQTTWVNANWKNGAEAFLESYHIRYIHPESNPFVTAVDYAIRHIDDHSLMEVPFGIADSIANPDVPDWDEALDSMEWTLDAFEEDSSMVAQLRGVDPPPGTRIRDVLLPTLRTGMTGIGMDVSGLTDEQLIDDWNVFVFPNVMLNVFAFGYWLFRVQPHPTDPDWCRFDLWYHHRVPDDQELPAPAANVDIPAGESCGPVMDQDFRNIPHQQAGMHSRAFPGPLLSSYESRIGHLHDVIDRYLGQDR